ncbi:DNA-directed RNA polymerase subunit omega [Anaplasmataceae bacterium AB001_6]|nr:DNA-directed RNA polymerase subunit omega [Anaplasmataceae bacterium AB001_6]
MRDNLDSRFGDFMTSVLVSQRVHELDSGSDPLVEKKNKDEKNVLVALREAECGMIDSDYLMKMVIRKVNKGVSEMGSSNNTPDINPNFLKKDDEIDALNANFSNDAKSDSNITTSQPLGDNKMSKGKSPDISFQTVSDDEVEQFLSSLDTIKPDTED